ncbi:MAG: type I restriction-modification system endonuclease, partial [Peptococcaceae bacterium]|nr:type I restriction-modification system endonuclease [Peptococcaceae bacterium]
MKGNFSFLEARFPALEKMGSLAESYLYSDPNTCLYKMGSLTEIIVKYMFELDGLKQPANDNTHAGRIKILQREGIIKKDIAEILNTIRQKRNLAVHEGIGTFEECETLLEMTHRFTVWFMRTYGDTTYQPVMFVLPEDIRNQAGFQKLLDENELLAAQLEKSQAAELSTLVHTDVLLSDRRRYADRASRNMKLSEKETRFLIDEQLHKVGWEADSFNLRYSKGTRPEKGRNIAIAEWPTDSSVCNWGYVDYALFAGLKLVGVIEAKAANKDVSLLINDQCREYSLGIKDEHNEYVINTWGEYKAPFLFATNGRAYLPQHETKSGIWFRDARDDANIPKVLQGWIAPHGLLELLEKDIVAANRKLVASSYDFLRDKDGLNLRPYQIEAIEKAEGAVLEGRQTALLAMATGTGKTRTVLGMIYRFLKTGRFKRVLFLVDRTALCEQVLEVFREVYIEDHLTFDQIYDVNHFSDSNTDREIKVHIATVQNMVRRILYDETESVPSVTDYDLIIVDEAHRGYIIDRELGGKEQLYRNQRDYVNRYRSVVDYFDAVKIALTATPALHTVEIFGNPVYEYSYRRAVIEGYLVDHEPPRMIRTKLQDKGIAYPVGETVPVYDPFTGEITNNGELEDESAFDVDGFNRNVTSESFNRTVLEEIARDINPGVSGKTLIYAVDDNHADLIVKLLKEIYKPKVVPNDAIMKITGSIGGGNQNKVLETVRRFQNEEYPNIAVTVDLLTTGIDVPEITTIVFMRRIKSRILFEQMMGRA